MPFFGTTTRRVVAFALAFMAAAVLPASAATIIANTERSGDAIDIHASMELHADAVTAWRVLTDYDRYTEFIPDLRVSRVIVRREATVTVEQSGDAKFWLFKMSLDVTFEINEFPPNSLRSHAVAGSLRALASSYALTPATQGVRLDYSGRITPGFALFGHIEEIAVKQNIARQLQAFADEIERQGAAARQHADAGVH